MSQPPPAAPSAPELDPRQPPPAPPGVTNLAALWESAAREHADRLAFADEDGRLTYAAADREVRRLAAMLAALGVGRGDPVALMLPNSTRYALLYWAALRRGALVAPINTRLGPDEFRALFAKLAPKVLVLHPEMRPRLEPALGGDDRLPGVGAVVSTGHGVGGRAPWPPGALVLDERLAATDSSKAEAAPAPALAPDDLAIVMHTSGTTGRPKGALMRHRDVLFNLEVATRGHGLRPDDVHLLVLPMFHATALYSLLPAAARYGAELAFCRKTEVPAALETVVRERATTFFGVPTFFQFLVESPEPARHDLTSLRLVAYAGSRMPPETIRRLGERLPGVRRHNFFGLTETTSMTHLLPAEEADRRPDSIGRLLPGVRAAVLDVEGRELGLDEIGELAFARENVVSGYWGEPGRLEADLTPDGRWWRTGDLARAQADGYWYLAGRRKEMIIVGGENVYAAEVEAVLCAYPQVAEAAVVGVPATGLMAWMGELVQAFVVPRAGAALQPRELQAFCVKHLASYKVPQRIAIRAELPKNTLGKVVKRRLVEEG